MSSLRATEYSYLYDPWYSRWCSREGFMRWHNAGTGMVALMLLTGCPSEFGKEGRIAKAIHQDTLELVRKRCSPEEEQRYCGAGREHSPECRDKCG